MSKKRNVKCVYNFEWVKIYRIIQLCDGFVLKLSTVKREREVCFPLRAKLHWAISKLYYILIYIPTSFYKKTLLKPTRHTNTNSFSKYFQFKKKIKVCSGFLPRLWFSFTFINVHKQFINPHKGLVKLFATVTSNHILWTCKKDMLILTDHEREI